MILNPQQRKQISSQIDAYEKKVGVGNVKVPFLDSSFDLIIDEYVANPLIMNSGFEMVNYLASRAEIIKGKTVIDIGTGSGIVGIAAALLGAKNVIMSDIEDRAVTNAQKNVDRLRLGKVCKVFKSDLFEKYKDSDQADIQIFNHPYFPDKPVEGKEWTNMMLGGTDLFARYLKEAPHFSTSDALYIFPWLVTANNENTLDNDPSKRGPEFGYKIVRSIDWEPVRKGLQQAPFRFYELKYKTQSD